MKKMMKLVSVLVVLSALVLTGCDVDPVPESGGITVDITNATGLAADGVFSAGGVDYVISGSSLAIRLFPTDTTIEEAIATGATPLGEALFALEGSNIGQTASIVDGSVSGDLTSENEDNTVDAGSYALFAVYATWSLDEDNEPVTEIVSYTELTVNVDGDISVDVDFDDFTDYE